MLPPHNRCIQVAPRTSTTQLVVSIRHIADIRRPKSGFGRVLLVDGEHKRRPFPLLITSPVNEAYWPGRSRQLYEMVNCPKRLVEFTEADGADLHCEPKGIGIRDFMFSIGWTRPLGSG